MVKNQKCTPEDLRSRISELEQCLRTKSEEVQHISAAQNLLNVLTDIQTRYISDVEPSKVFNLLLTNLLSITQSEYGFIGEVLFDEDENPYLKTHAITNIAWNKHWDKFYQENAPGGMLFTNLKTLFGAVMTSGLTVISNDPENDPRRGGLPQGHPALNSFLGIPVDRGGQLVGMVGIANKPGGYDEEIATFLKPFVASCATIIESLRAERLKREAEDALHENEAKLQGILKTAADPIITVNERGTIRSFNPAAKNMFGYNVEEVIGKNVSMLMPSPHRERHDSYIANYLRTGVSKIIGIGREVRALRKDGSEFFAELALSKIKTGGKISFTGILRDITDRKNAEATKEELLREIQSNHQTLLTILNQLRLGVVTIDGEGHVTFINQHCAQILQKRRDEDIAGKHWYNVFAFEDLETSILKSALKNITPTKQTIVTTIRTNSGHKYWLEVEIHQDPRQARDAILFIYDVTEVHSLRDQLDKNSQFHGLLGKSEPMQRVFQQLQNLSTVDSTVLIQGETGTGKELIARAIHDMSARKGKPFIAVNCAGLTQSLIASQLFGYRKGAFTGALEDRMGIFETAHGGTVFLDEIAEIPFALQANLLRVLQEKEIVRIGESQSRKINVRLISATNVDLQQEVKNKFFRSDLYYRLHVASIQLPPLRERGDDIPLLIRFFLDKLRPLSNSQIDGRAMATLLSYNWPGNVRELQNTLESSIIGMEGDTLYLKDIPEQITGYVANMTPQEAERKQYREAISQKERRLIRALKETRGNRAAAAKLLGIGRTTLYRQIKDFGLTSVDW